ncbi:hypothetical protein GCM10010387_15340 [Streptomyces inusitatus]|uniref:Uncharacterized protein n=1 Tax=Streptomyces inusitatus TaxID=68221 RepID=A0A918UNN6_9ACTN|nr:hypothetical protein [Streptomyces inusitatus]GGZ23169.1 hypothetical protein GCM10010387_15340 [Streptomyces inusitatus]
MTSQTPSVGRIVHYVSHGTPLRSDGSQAFRSACRGAMVTEVDSNDPGRVGLAIENPTGKFYHPLSDGGCVLDEAGCGAGLGGTWHWPEWR